MGDPDFRDLREHELIELSDERLIDYIRKARAAGRTAAMTLALQILVFGHLDTVKRRVALKVPRGEVDDLAHDAMASALRSAFAGESVGEFRAWLHTIVARRIADHWRRREGKPEERSLLSGEEEDEWGEVPAVEFEGVPVDAERAIEGALAGLSDEHRRIVEGYVFDDRPGGEVAAEHGTSEANVHQIASRFRRRLRELLDDDGDGTRGADR